MLDLATRVAATTIAVRGPTISENDRSPAVPYSTAMLNLMHTDSNKVQQDAEDNQASIDTHRSVHD